MAAVEVSRETPLLPAPSEAAVSFFGPNLAAVAEYAELLAGEGVVRGLIGPREVPRLWERHLLNCAVVAEVVPHGARVDDVGSGAGLPGIVLGLIRPDLEIVLVEPLLRRSTFLEEACRWLGMTNVAVVRQRAEERAASHPDRDVVTARAVAPLSRLVGWCLPLLRPGGVLLALKGSSAGEELGASAKQIRAAGGVGGEILKLGAGIVEPPTTVVRITSDMARPAGRKSGRDPARVRPRQERGRRP